MSKSLKKHDVTIRYTFESCVDVLAIDKKDAKEVAFDILFEGVPWEESNVDVVDKLMSMAKSEPLSFHAEVKAVNVKESDNV